MRGSKLTGEGAEPSIPTPRLPEQAAAALQLIERSDLDELTVRRLRRNLRGVWRALTPAHGRFLVEAAFTVRLQALDLVVRRTLTPEQRPIWLRFLGLTEEELEAMLRKGAPPTPEVVQIYSALFEMAKDQPCPPE